ncbi:MAG TPA: FAD-binding protein, partial [Vicinamibacteria bacterium]|nr:FAD-binding protein [Vicinamibacteria bacterium]
MGLDVRENVPLAPLTTLGVGGPARYYAQAHGEDDLRAALRHASQRGLPLLVLGGGSNVVLSDEGHPGLVVHLALRGLESREKDGHVELVAAAGEPWDQLVAHAVSRGWAGLECLSGIPGLVGATPIQNVGAYGQEVCETITAVVAIDRATGERVRLSNPECGFAYRMSRFKSGDAGRYVVVEV